MLRDIVRKRLQSNLCLNGWHGRTRTDTLRGNSAALGPSQLHANNDGGTDGTRTRYLPRDRRVFYSVLNYGSVCYFGRGPVRARPRCRLPLRTTHSTPSEVPRRPMVRPSRTRAPNGPQGLESFPLRKLASPAGGSIPTRWALVGYSGMRLGLPRQGSVNISPGLYPEGSQL